MCARRSAVSLVELIAILSILAILLALTSTLVLTGVRFAESLESKVNAAKRLASERPHAGSVHTKSLPIADQYIVVLRNGVNAAREAGRLSQFLPLEVAVVYTRVFQGFAAKLSAAALPALLADPAVRYVEQDQTLVLAAASVSRGLQRINAVGPTGSATTDADIAVIDTGIDPANSTLDVVHQQGFGYGSAKDTDGHGTQVASIIAAMENGVAPAARIWALKVAEASGSGSTANLISALDFLAARADRIDVANISVLTGKPSLAANLAAAACVRAGVTVVVAAGNNQRNVSSFSPANEPSVITVAALADTDGQLGGRGAGTRAGDADDTLAASFSNYGDLVDFLAPGTDVFAIDLANTPSRANGTSFAAAHVSGVAALLRSQARAARNAIDVRSQFQALVRESIPGPGRQTPYAVINAGLSKSVTAASQMLAVQMPSMPATPQRPSLPLSYEANLGQSDPQVRFLTRAKNYTAFLTAQGIVLSLASGGVQRIQFAGANPQPAITGQTRLPGIVNYFLGADPTKWLTNVPTYSSVWYDEFYPGIDLLCYSDRGRLRYDLLVAAGADPSQVTLDFADALAVKVDRAGQLLVSLPGGDLMQSAPIVYQQAGARRDYVRGRYVIVGGNQVRFEIGEYDTRRPLIIDPYLASTYLGGSGQDFATSIALDGAGNAYVTGDTRSADFPILGGIQPSNAANTDIFVTKINASGTALLYSTYVGGAGNENGLDIAVDAAGNAYVVGSGSGPVGTAAFPTTPGAFENNNWAGNYVPVFKLNPTGNVLLYSTIPNGRSNERGGAIAVDAAGNAYVAGWNDQPANSLAATPGAFQTNTNGRGDVFVMKINPTATGVIFSTYLGGSGSDTPNDIAIDAAGDVYVVGETQSTDFPLANAVQSTAGGGSDAFVAKISATGANLLYSTYLGGTGFDDAKGIDLDAAGNAYVTGTSAGSGFLTTPGAFQATPQGNNDAYVAKINPSGNALVYSTFIGTAANDAGNDIAVDGTGNAYITGQTRSDLFPNMNPAQLPWPSGTDAVVAALNPTGTALIFASHVGGPGNETGNSIALGSGGVAWLAGETSSTSFPTLSPIQAAAGGSQDGFVVRLSPGGAAVPGVTITQTAGSTDVAEGGASDTYTVVLDTAPFFNVNITLNAGPQLTVAATLLSFTPLNWNTPQTVTVTAIDDGVAEGAHNGTITHSAASADSYYSGIAVAPVTVKITDNDSIGVTIVESGGSTDVVEGGATDSYTVALNSQPTANVTFTLTPDSQVTVTPAAWTFTPGNWDVPRTITVRAVNDAMAEGPHTGTVKHSAASTDTNYNGLAIADVVAKITDNNASGITITEAGGFTVVSENGGANRYTVVLKSAPTAIVTVTINPGTQLTVSPATTLVFTPTDWDQGQTITVGAVDDFVAEGQHTGAITHSVTSADPAYDGIAVASVTATINDNDTAGVTVTQSGGSTRVAEGGATDSYTVVLNSQPTANVAVAINPGTQLTVAPATLTFTSANWNTPQMVTVTAVDDSAIEGTHTGVIGHAATSSDTLYNAISIANVNVTITDNDAAGVTVTESGAGTDVAEGGASDSYAVVLNSVPTANVTISINPGMQLAVSPTPLTFTPTNWDTPQAVTVTAVDDAVVEGLHTGTITHTASSSDNRFNSITIASVTANVTDNDSAGVIVTESAGSTTVGEGGPGDTYTVSLKSSPTANLTITISGGTQLSVAPASLVFTPANWNTLQTVTVTAVDDTVIEGPHSGSISHTAVSTDTPYSGITVAGVMVSITDNDFPASVTVTESAGFTKVTEGGPADSYAVVLISAPSADVTITITPDTQVTVTPATLTFTATDWNIPQTVTITAVDDAAIETNPHTGVITHSTASADTKYNNLTVAGISVTIFENDFPPPDAADTSERASYMGTLSGTKIYKNLDTLKHTSGKFDNDWYAWTMTTSGTFTMNLNNVKVVASGPKGQYAFGDLHFRIFRVTNGNLIQLGASQESGSKIISAPVNQNERILVWVYGLFYTQAYYDLAVDLK